MRTPLRSVIIPIGPSIAYVELTQGQFALIDAEDAEGVAQFSWSAHWDKHTGSFYARRFEKRKTILLHRSILSPASGKLCDHANGNTLDNRRFGNLREATRAENARNCRKHLCNTSGRKGVHFHRRVGKWQARITVNDKLLHLGFGTKEEAIALREAAEVRYFGEFRRAA